MTRFTLPAVECTGHAVYKSKYALALQVAAHRKTQLSNTNYLEVTVSKVGPLSRKDLQGFLINKHEI